jgi:O-acetyl-ADP-ribose deacetylase (regulator of RNase III)
MSNRVSIKMVHGAYSGMETPCSECGASYGLVDYVEATDHAIGKKYSFAIVTCECKRILNKEELRSTLPDIIFHKVFYDDQLGRDIHNIGIRIIRMSGDITMIDSDAIITAINSGRLWFGGIDGAIRKVAGNIYHVQVPNVELTDLDIIIARGDHNNHKGKFDNVVFVVDDLRSELSDVIAIGLEEADTAGFKKVTIPAIRTGVMLGAVEKSLEQVADEYMKGIMRYVDRKRVNREVPGIHTIIFVTYNNPKLEEILHNVLFKK